MPGAMEATVGALDVARVVLPAAAAAAREAVDCILREEPGSAEAVRRDGEAAMATVSEDQVEAGEAAAAAEEAEATAH